MAQVKRRMVHPGKRVQEGFVRIDEMSERSVGAMMRHVNHLQVRVKALNGMLQQVAPSKGLELLRGRKDALARDLFRLTAHAGGMRRQRWKEIAARLESLSPLGVLARGYSITRVLSSGKIVRRAVDVNVDDPVGIILSEGELECAVSRIVCKPVENEPENV